MNLEEATQKALLNETSFEQLDGDIIIKELCKNLNMDSEDLLARLDELNLDSWKYLELVDAYEAEGYDIKDILDDYEFDELKVNLNEGKFNEQDIENQENADIREQGDMPNNKSLPRKELAISAGKKFKTPKGNELRISVLTLDTNTTSKKASLYISCYIGDKNYQCHSIEEFCDVYLNN